MAKPFLKWAGGKRQLLPDIMERLPADVRECKKYIEPFVGAGAVLFHLLESEEFRNLKEYHIIDVNIELILCYEAIKEDAALVYSELEKLMFSYPKTHEERADRSISGSYYDIRAKWNQNIVSRLNELKPASRAIRVAQTIFLNRTCFNGLYRVNKQGEFNVPIGRYKKVSFPTERMLKEVQIALQDVQIHLGSFEKCEDLADENTFLYFDPPYRPISKTASFTSYTKDGFDEQDLKNLFDLYYRLNEKHCLLMMSNSGRGGTPDEDYIEAMFHQFDVDEVKATRAINSKGNSRGAVNEIIVKNALSNKEIISYLNGLMVPEERYTARQLSELLVNGIVLSPIDQRPMPSDGKNSPRYHRMVKNAIRCSPDYPNHPSKVWEHLRIEEEKSDDGELICYLETKNISNDDKFEVILDDKTKILFGRGRIDDWCVYVENNGTRSAPKDVEYFSYLKKLGLSIGNQRVYSEFCEIWEKVTMEPDKSIKPIIRDLVSEHPEEFKLNSEKWYSVLYMTMVSEENYKNTKLGKRLKRLGVYQLLIEGSSANEAANWSRGKRWREIASVCEKHGF